MSKGAMHTRKWKRKKRKPENGKPCKKLCRNNPSVQQHILKERGKKKKKIPRITASPHMRPDRTHLLVLPQMAKTYPESAVASTCIESFALIGVHDKLEKKETKACRGYNTANACYKERIRKKKKGRYRKKSVAKQRKQDVKKKCWSLSAEKKKKKGQQATSPSLQQGPPQHAKHSQAANCQEA